MTQEPAALPSLLFLPSQQLLVVVVVACRWRPSERDSCFPLQHVFFFVVVPAAAVAADAMSYAHTCVCACATSNAVFIVGTELLISLTC